MSNELVQYRYVTDYEDRINDVKEGDVIKVSDAIAICKALDEYYIQLLQSKNSSINQLHSVYNELFKKLKDV